MLTEFGQKSHSASMSMTLTTDLITKPIPESKSKQINLHSVEVIYTVTLVDILQAFGLHAELSVVSVHSVTYKTKSYTKQMLQFSVFFFIPSSLSPLYPPHSHLLLHSPFNVCLTLKLHSPADRNRLQAFVEESQHCLCQPLICNSYADRQHRGNERESVKGGGGNDREGILP